MLAGLVIVSLVAHAGSVREARQALEQAERPTSAEGSVLAAYTSRALASHPLVDAAFARWEAAVHRTARARALPEPSVSFGAYLQAVETRVGPQQARIGLRQVLPWPTRLTAGADASAEVARAAEHQFDAVALAVTERVAVAYWTLWSVRAARALHADHLEVLDGLSVSVRGRVETGAASLADLQQVDLSRARLADDLVRMDAEERAAGAGLAAAVGELGPWKTDTPPPPPAVPAETTETLAAAVSAHPSLAAIAAGARSADARARQAGAGRLPGLSLGADWIITGELPGPIVPPDNGKDAVVAVFGLTLPLWQGVHAREVAASRATAEALRADQRAAELDARAALTATLAEVEDSARRVGLIGGTLLPQAESAHRSVLGSVSAGRGSVTQALLSQADLLDLRVELARARATHAGSWARLRALVGRDVLTAEAP